jgi:hypothetical protein
MASNQKGGLYWWVGALGFLIIAGIAVIPRLLGKSAVITPPTGVPAVTPSIAASIPGAVPAGYDYGVANSQYGHLRNYNFAGLAIESPSSAMPLGFHLNNIV